MNVSDSEIVHTVLESAGYQPTDDMTQSDIILLNTCAIREGAEKKIWNKLESQYHALKKNNKKAVVGVLGCMAERVKERFLENKVVDLVAGPDAYRDLPRLLKILEQNTSNSKQSREKAMNV